MSLGQSVLNAGISGGISGYISTGKLHGAIMGSLESIAFAGMHVVKADLGVNTGTLGGAAASAGMHGAVGGMFSMAEGGKFSSGFLAAGISDLAGNGDAKQMNALDTAKHAVAGGVGSVLGGGKFGNGAVTGAFGYLYNSALQGGNGQAGANGSTGSTSMQRVDLSAAFDVLGKIWSLPNTAIGLTLGTFDGLIGVAMGQIPQIGFGEGAIQISNLPNIWGNVGGITFGDVQMYTGVSPSTMINSSRYTGLGGFPIEHHEGAHTIQSDLLGPLFFPAYGIAALANGWYSNPFETSADRHAAYGASALPW